MKTFKEYMQITETTEAQIPSESDKAVSYLTKEMQAVLGKGFKCSAYKNKSQIEVEFFGTKNAKKMSDSNTRLAIGINLVVKDGVLSSVSTVLNAISSEMNNAIRFRKISDKTIMGAAEKYIKWLKASASEIKRLNGE